MYLYPFKTNTSAAKHIKCRTTEVEKWCELTAINGWKWKNIPCGIIFSYRSSATSRVVLKRLIDGRFYRTLRACSSDTQNRKENFFVKENFFNVLIFFEKRWKEMKKVAVWDNNQDNSRTYLTSYIAFFPFVARNF